MSEPGLASRTLELFRYGLGYFGYRRAMRPAEVRRGASDAASPPASLPPGLATQLASYPSNHRYRIEGRRLVPSYKLYRRAQVVESLCSPGLTSLLDIGCCRGYYVFGAAGRPTCRAAVGIDVFEPFIRTAKQVQDHLGAANVRFYLAGLDEVARDPAAFGGPFQTIVLIGTYHYVYWGSVRCQTAFRSHREILSRLAGLCTDRVILSARLTVSDLPDDLKELAQTAPEAKEYTPEGFHRAAEEFFDVRPSGRLGDYPVHVLSKRA
jgi:hypothetical protein